MKIFRIIGDAGRVSEGGSFLIFASLVLIGSGSYLATEGTGGLLITGSILLGFSLIMFFIKRTYMLAKGKRIYRKKVKHAANTMEEQIRFNNDVTNEMNRRRYR